MNDSSVENFPFHEKKEQMLVQKTVKGGMTVFDIGANIGDYSILFSQLVGQSGKVYSFEPTSSTFNKLLERLKEYHCDNVLAFKKAIYSENKLLELNEFPDEYSSWNSIGKPQMNDPNAPSNYVPIVNTEIVEAVRLDTFCEAHNIKNIDYLKIDVEGAESYALEGAISLLKKQAISFLQFEISQKMLEGLNCKAKETFDILIEHGYECHRIKIHGSFGELVNDSNSFYENYIAFPVNSQPEIKNYELEDENRVMSMETTIMSAYQSAKEELASKVFDSITSQKVKERVYSVISRLTQDRWLSNDLRNYSSSSTQTQSQWFDLISFLNWCAHNFQPKNYLEVGVRRGRSMAQVLVESADTDAYGFDMWIPGYAAEDNPGPEFVRSELEKLGIKKQPTFIRGDSHETLPSFFANSNNPQEFDLINIDGDHTYSGAKMDLDVAFAHLAPGGVLVFDDISHHAHPELGVLWNEYKSEYQDYLFIDDRYGTGTGVAFKPPFSKLSQIVATLPIHFFTIVLNGEPFIRYHIDILKQLPFKWHWHIIEGVADLKHDTGWSLQLGGKITDEIHKNGRSKDGTSEYLDELAVKYPENVTIYRKPEGEFWDGKREMVNAPLANIKEECLLWQVDVDEMWTLEQICNNRKLFIKNPEKTAAFYWCWYFVGADLVISSRNCYAENPQQDWLRTWRFKPGYVWAAHEPPVLVENLPDGQQKNVAALNPFMHAETEKEGLIFQHFAYVTAEQLRFKEQYYGYQNAVSQWGSLQSQTKFPVFLREYFAWVGDNTMVDRAESLGVVPLVQKDVNAGSWKFLQAESLRQPVTLEKRSPTMIIDGVFFQLYSTGIARVWRSLLEQWAKSQFAPHIIVLDRLNTTPKIPGIRYRTVPPYNYNNTDADKQILQQVCDEEGADLFISTYYTTPISTPSVFMGYDMIPEVVGADFNEPMWREKHDAIGHAFSYISISESTARDLIKFFPDITPDEVTVAHCGVAPTFTPATATEISAFKHKYGISKPYFLLVGAGSNYKNAILFFRAFAELHSKQGFEIVCTGSGVTLANEYRQYASGSVVHSLILSDEELKVAYSGAVALVYPSLYEGFGMPIAEALACGCPVITCANASIPEVAGEAAIYVDTNDVDGLTDALCEIQKPKVRNSLIAAGLAQVKQFSWTNMADTMSSALMKATLGRLNLREINLIIFPDWSQPEETVGLELQEVIKSLVNHPDRSKMTLLIDNSNISVEEADLILSSVAMNLLMEEDLEVDEGPEIVLLGEFSQTQWFALMPQLKGRIKLEHENEEAIATLETTHITTLSLSDFAND